MKRILILIAIFCSVLSAKAQLGGGSTIVGRISGSVIDSVTKETMPYTTVALFRSTGKSPLNGVLTDDKGSFKIDNVKPGTYRVEITFVGYPTKVVNNITTTLSKPDKALGIVVISPSAKTLKEVQVTGAKALIENRIDKIVYNAEKDLTAAGGNATDVLQKVPLVAVDINGNVSLRGDGNVRVLINGKPSGATSSNLADVLKTIPADQIKSIEVITSPSAKYDAEGTAGILNIITKTSNISGFSGSISGGVGTRQNNGNASLSYNQNRFSLTANFGGNLTWPQTTLTDFSQRFQHDTVNTSQDNVGSTLIKRHADVGNVTATYDINSFNNVSSTFKLTQGGFNSDQSQADNFTDFNHPTKNLVYSNTSNSHTSINSFDWNIDYTHKFKKEGHELSFSTQWSHNSTDVNYTTIYTSRFPNQLSLNNAKGDEYTLQADYADPITKNFTFEAGAKSIFRNISSGVNNSSPDASGNFVYNPVTSFLYNYDQNVFAGYTELTYALPKGYTVMAGVRVENTAITGDPQNSTQPNLTLFTQNYTTFVPSFTVQKALTPSQTIKLSYSKRISRPSLTYLNPYLNQANIQSQSKGNPQLAPEVAQTVELNYNAFVGTAILNASVFYKYTNGLIESIATPIITNIAGIAQSGTLTSYANIGNNNSFGGSFFGSVNPISIITLRGQISAYTYNPNPTGAFAAESTTNSTYVQYNAFGSASLNTKSGFITELFVVQTSPRRTIQGTNPSFSLFGLGVRQQFDNKRASVGINVLSPFEEYKHFDTHISSPGFATNSTVQFPFRSIGLTFSYSFGKLNFNTATDKKAIKNDDLKQGDSGVGGGAPDTGGGSQKPPQK
jgi:outer membrane receptor protein involved in Fe transport